MKVAISVPDPIFSAAERLASRMHVSRSQLYARALEEYLAKRQDSLITDQLNAVHGEPARIDPALAAAQIKSLGDETW
jgi:hypothetical protein